MIAVIFEVWPKPTTASRNTSTSPPVAAAARPIDGFISIERFESLYEPGQDSLAVVLAGRSGDRGLAQYGGASGAQAKGRAKVFADYRLRIAGVIRDYGMRDRKQVPADSRAAHGSPRAQECI